MIRDENGLTEEEFLNKYDTSGFERPSVTVDIILLDGKKVLLIRRAGHPFIGKWALPGGFVEPDESAEQAALRELNEETGVTNAAVKQLRCFSVPDRDPRTRIITIAFTAHLISDNQNIAAGDDASQAEWFDVAVLPLKKYQAKEGGVLFSVSEYKIMLSNPNRKISCSVQRKTPIFPFPVDSSYKVNGENLLAGDHAAILAAAIDSRPDLFGNLH